ncbi:MAG: hypothetical protein E4H26_04370 [Flavobacteriales bacterium]|nr:MAG: hypothetical protein E4H26_04370 [Flavobacteriales bacterium]
MKPTTLLFIFAALVTLSLGNKAYGQKMVVLSIDSSSGVVSFSAPDSEVENPGSLEDFTIVIDVSDEIEWEGVSTSGEIVDIEDIDIVDDRDLPNSDKIFKKNRSNRGKKKVKVKIKDNKKEDAKGRSYKYKISYSLGSNDPIEIDPVIKVKN